MRQEISYRAALGALMLALLVVGSGMAATQRVFAAPTITDFTPKTGGEGTKVVITGTGLTGAKVSFFDVPATAVMVNAQGTTLTATVPALPADVPPPPAPIVVATPGGSATSSASFTYASSAPAPTPTPANKAQPATPAAKPTTNKPTTSKAKPAFASGGENVRIPDAKAVPLLANAKITLVQGIKQVEAKYGPAIEAKFELDDSGTLSLSVYPAAKGLHNDAEFNVFEEASGPATASPWKPSIEVFKDAEHLTRSAFDLTLMQQSKVNLARAVQRALAQQPGIAYWAIPILRGKTPAIGIYIQSSDGKSHHVVIPAT